MKFVINQYDLNGKHTIIDGKNRPMAFESEAEAIEFLKRHGCSEEYIENLSIEEVEDEEVLKEVFISSQPL